MKPIVPTFVTLDRDALSAVTGGLSSTIRARPRAQVPPGAEASSGVDAKLNGLVGALQSLKQPAPQQGQPAPQQAAPSFGGIPLQQLMGA